LAVLSEQRISARVSRSATISARILTVAALVLAGTLLLIYPILRPFSSETGMTGAVAFGSANWVLAHSLALAGFIALGLALLGTYQLLLPTPGHRWARWGLVLSWIGIGGTLAYYGAEVFGLHGVGEEAVAEHNPALMAVVDHIRWEAGLFWILGGLALLGIGVVLLAIAIWRSGWMPRWSGVLLAVAFALYIPQYAAPQAVRIAHGALILAGGVVLAWGVRGARADEAPL
jgi:hypothetical protein